MVRPCFLQQSTAPENKNTLIFLPQNGLIFVSCGILMVLEIWGGRCSYCWFDQCFYTGGKARFYSAIIKKLLNVHTSKVTQLCSFWCPDGALNLQGVGNHAVGLICNMKWVVRWIKWWRKRAQDKWCSAWLGFCLQLRWFLFTGYTRNVGIHQFFLNKPIVWCKLPFTAHSKNVRCSWIPFKCSEALQFVNVISAEIKYKYLYFPYLLQDFIYVTTSSPVLGHATHPFTMNVRCMVIWTALKIFWQPCGVTASCTQGCVVDNMGNQIDECFPS